jgi:hypothetical protein
LLGPRISLPFNKLLLLLVLLGLLLSLLAANLC